MLYWTDTSERGPAIYRLSVVDASLETLVSVNLGWPNALTVDFTGKQEASTSKVHNVDIDLIQNCLSRAVVKVSTFSFVISA